MPRRSRAAAVLAAAAALAAVPATAQGAIDLTHGERFGNAPNEIVDLSRNGSFLVATQGKQVVRYDLSDLDNPVQTALTTGTAIVTGNGTGDNEPGPTSVALVRDQFVLVPFNDNSANVSGQPPTIDPVDGIKVLDATTLAVVRSVSFNDATATGVAGAPSGTPGTTPLLEVPDAVAVSPDQTRAVVAVENDREVGQPSGGVPGFVRVDTSAADPNAWTFELLSLPAAFLAAEGADAQPEFVDIRGDNAFAGTIQEANALVTSDLDTAGPATLPTPVSVGTSASWPTRSTTRRSRPSSSDEPHAGAPARHRQVGRWRLAARARQRGRGRCGRRVARLLDPQPKR